MKNDLDDYRYPVTEYLTRYLEKITINEEMFDYQKEYQIFCDTFHFINSVIGENAFSGKTGMVRLNKSLFCTILTEFLFR